MEVLEQYFSSIDPVFAAFIATVFTWFLTGLGASLVFFFKTMHRGVLDGMLGFTGGVMVAASFWSLLTPAIEMSEINYPNMPWFPSAVGFITGALFLFFLDKKLPHLHLNFKETEKEGIKTQLHKSTLLVLAITLHNIPEGLAVGVLFGGVSITPEKVTEHLLFRGGLPPPRTPLRALPRPPNKALPEGFGRPQACPGTKGISGIPHEAVPPMRSFRARSSPFSDGPI